MQLFVDKQDLAHANTFDDNDPTVSKQDLVKALIQFYKEQFADRALVQKFITEKGILLKNNVK